MMGSWFMYTVNSAKGLIHSVTSFIIMREADTLLVDIIIILTYKIAINQKQVDKSFGSYTWFEVFGGLYTRHTNYNSGCHSHNRGSLLIINEMIIAQLQSNAAPLQCSWLIICNNMHSNNDQTVRRLSELVHYSLVKLLVANAQKIRFVSMFSLCLLGMLSLPLLFRSYKLMLKATTSLIRTQTSILVK